MEKEEKREEKIQVPQVSLIKLKKTIENKTVSPMEIAIRDALSEFYQIDKNKIEVVIQEPD